MKIASILSDLVAEASRLPRMIDGCDCEGFDCAAGTEVNSFFISPNEKSGTSAFDVTFALPIIAMIGAGAWFMRASLKSSSQTRMAEEKMHKGDEYFMKGNYDRAIDAYHRSLAMFYMTDDLGAQSTDRLASIYRQLALISQRQNEKLKAAEYHAAAARYHEDMGLHIEAALDYEQRGTALGLIPGHEADALESFELAAKAAKAAVREAEEKGRPNLLRYDSYRRLIDSLEGMKQFQTGTPRTMTLQRLAKARDAYTRAGFGEELKAVAAWKEYAKEAALTYLINDPISPHEEAARAYNNIHLLLRHLDKKTSDPSEGEMSWRITSDASALDSVGHELLGAATLSLRKAKAGASSGDLAAAETHFRIARTIAKSAAAAFEDSTRTILAAPGSLLKFSPSSIAEKMRNASMSLYLAGEKTGSAGLMAEAGEWFERAGDPRQAIELKLKAANIFLMEGEISSAMKMARRLKEEIAQARTAAAHGNPHFTSFELDTFSESVEILNEHAIGLAQKSARRKDAAIREMAFSLEQIPGDIIARTRLLELTEGRPESEIPGITVPRDVILKALEEPARPAESALKKGELFERGLPKTDIQ